MVPNYLRHDAKLSERFSKIAKVRVDIYFNNKRKRWELWYKGNLIIGLLDGGLISAPSKVYSHFREIRNRVGHKRLAEYLKRDIAKEEEQDFQDRNHRYWDEQMPELERADRNRTTFS